MESYKLQNIYMKNRQIDLLLGMLQMWEEEAKKDIANAKNEYIKSMCEGELIIIKPVISYLKML